MSLTHLQQRFVDEMLIDPTSATAAYKRAGGKGKKGSSARKQAARLVADGNVRAALEKARMERAERVKVDGDWVVEKLIEQVRRCMTEIPVLGTNGEPTGEFTYDAAGANAALRMLGMHFGIFERDNRQRSGTDLEAVKNRLKERGIDVDKLRERSLN